MKYNHTYGISYHEMRLFAEGCSDYYYCYFLYFKNKSCYRNGGYVSKDETKILVLYETINCGERFKEEMKYMNVEKKNVVHDQRQQKKGKDGWEYFINKSFTTIHRE